MTSRLDDVECKVAFVEGDVRALDEVVRELATRLEVAERRIADLLELVERGGAQARGAGGPGAEPGADEGPESERPPHYDRL